MSFSRPIQWYHSHVDLIWPNGGTFNPEACVLLFIYKFLLCPASVSIVYLFRAGRLCCVLGPAHVLSLCSTYNLPILFGKTVLCVGPRICYIIYLFCVGRLCCVLGPAYVILFIYFVWEDCAVCWAQHMSYYLSILCGKTVLCVGPCICLVV
jgi:hypothetical protein